MSPGHYADNVTEPGTDPELDYEDGRRAYSVTVKVKAQNGEPQQVAQVTVTISVTDVDEPLTVKKAGDEDAPNLPGAAPEAESYPEVKAGAPNTDAVVTYVGADPEGATCKLGRERRRRLLLHHRWRRTQIQDTAGLRECKETDADTEE